MKTGTLTISTLLLTALLAFGHPAFSQPGTSLKPTETVFLYPEGQDSGKGLPEAMGAGVSNGIDMPESINGNGAIGNISDSARIDIYLPKKPCGQMIVVCPGGGYAFVSSYNEGIYVADWMLRQGIAVAVVKYRLPNGHWEVPLTDVQNAFRYCRAHAGEWGVRQIGVMGFSAGGHLAASAATMYTDKVTRPDFAVLVYPVINLDWKVSHGGTRQNLLGYDKDWLSREGKTFGQWDRDRKKLDCLVEHYSLNKNVSSDTPPTFLAHCTDDTTVPVENSILFYQALVAVKVPAEMHIYPTGGHGWGFSTEKFADKDNIGYCREEFEASLARWLETLNKQGQD